MTLRHLYIFLAVCQEGNMTKASKKLFMTQPSVTQAIKELEIFYKVNLFDREGKRITINDAGYKLLPIAENIIKSFEESKEIMRGNDIYQIKLGASATIGTYLLDSFINKTTNLKNIEIKYFVDNTLKIEEKILKGLLDIAVVEGNIHSSKISVSPFFEDELVLISSKKDNFFKNREIKMTNLNGINFVSREDGSGTKETLDAIFFNKNISVKNIATVNSIEAIKNLVISNIGYSIVPKISILKEYKTGLLNYYEIEDLKIIRNFKLISLKNKVINNHLNAVLELLKKSIIEEKDLKKWIFRRIFYVV